MRPEKTTYTTVKPACIDVNVTNSVSSRFSCLVEVMSINEIRWKDRRVSYDVGRKSREGYHIVFLGGFISAAATTDKLEAIFQNN